MELRLGVIWGELQVSVEHRFAAWLVTSAFRLDRHENGIDLFKHLRVIEFEDPPFLRRVVLVENSEIQSLFSVRSAPAPGLKCPGLSRPRFLVQVVRVKDERFALRVKQASG